MRCQRNVLVSVALLAASLGVAAQSGGMLRWRSGASALGLQPAMATPALQCGSFSLACDTTTVVPLYASPATERSLSMQLGTSDEGALRSARAPGLSLAVVGKGLFSDLGVYGRVGTTLGRGGAFAGMPGSESGLTYGVGLSWDFSRRASAVLGIDSYDVRGAAGDTRDVRATRLGLQWRY